MPTGLVRDPAALRVLPAPPRPFFYVSVPTSQRSPGVRPATHRLGDNECDDLCNNELNDFDGGDCLNVTMTEPDVPIETDLNGNGIRPGDERDDRPVVGAFNVCPGEWIGDGKCDVVCNVTRYNYDCNQEGQCDCQPDDVKGVIAAMPQADIGPAASCSAGSNFAPYERHCVAVGGRCTGKDGECNGVIRGKCGPDCYCCIGRSCDDVGDETYVGDGVCDDACNTEDYEYDGGDCKGSNEAAFRSHDAVCPVAWKGDGHCDIECRWVHHVLGSSQCLQSR